MQTLLIKCTCVYYQTIFNILPCYKLTTYFLSDSNEYLESLFIYLFLFCVWKLKLDAEFFLICFEYCK